MWSGSVQFNMVSTHSRKSTSTSPSLFKVFSALPRKYYHNVGLIGDGSFSSFRGRASSTSSFNASFFQMIDGTMSTALCPQVLAQAPQHFSSSETL